jgi:hypothetical protein
MSQPPLPKKRTTKSPSSPPSPKTPTPAPAPLKAPPPSMTELTPAELVEGLTHVVEQLKEIVDNPSKKPLTEEVGKRMEEIRKMSTFLSAVYANMIRIAVEEDKVTPEPPTEEQQALAMRTEALGWTLRALQEKAALGMNPPEKKLPVTAKRRKSRMQRTQGDGEWKRM